MHQSGKGHICFSNTTVLVWVKKKENRKPLRKKRLLEIGCCFFPFFGSCEYTSNSKPLFSSTDPRWKMVDKISSKKSSCPWSQTVPSSSSSHGAGWGPSPHHKGVHTPKAGSPLESEPSGVCEKQSSVLFWAGRSPPPAFCFLSSPSWANFEEGSLKTCLDSYALGSLRPLKAWRKHLRSMIEASCATPQPSHTNHPSAWLILTAVAAGIPPWSAKMAKVAGRNEVVGPLATQSHPSSLKAPLVQTSFLCFPEWQSPQRREKKECLEMPSECSVFH